VEHCHGKTFEVNVKITYVLSWTAWWNHSGLSLSKAPVFEGLIYPRKVLVWRLPVQEVTMIGRLLQYLKTSWSKVHPLNSSYIIIILYWWERTRNIKRKMRNSKTNSRLVYSLQGEMNKQTCYSKGANINHWHTTKPLSYWDFQQTWTNTWRNPNQFHRHWRVQHTSLSVGCTLRSIAIR
jgi:hypothetical protein